MVKNRSTQRLKDDDSSDEEEIKDLLKSMNISRRNESLQQQIQSASPLSSNASEDETGTIGQK